MTGRSASQKKQLAKQITQPTVEIGGTQPQDVWVGFGDMESQDWMVGVPPESPTDPHVPSPPGRRAGMTRPPRPPLDPELELGMRDFETL